jgi:hypothetical protein
MLTMRAETPESQAAITPQRALDYLREGNLRFVTNLRENRDLLMQANQTREGQWPFATILSCIVSILSSATTNPILRSTPYHTRSCGTYQDIQIRCQGSS